MIVAFTLTMPGNNSWNGRWSGDAKVYAVVKAFRRPLEAKYLGDFSYNFSDGWRANVNVLVVDRSRAIQLRQKKNQWDFAGTIG